MAALRMILLAYTGASPTVTELLKLGEKRGARVAAGWCMRPSLNSHENLASTARRIPFPPRSSGSVSPPPR
ncbi:hypothetical protein [Streptomyces sp. CA-106110]|uniref:hypothetical protein n=1 Tax=Streptomyces sp. CA-106110 TaxID=3240044 RepID=UPI003D8D57DE